MKRNKDGFLTQDGKGPMAIVIRSMKVSERKCVVRANMDLDVPNYKDFTSVTSVNLHENIGGEIIKAMIFLDACKMPGSAHTCFPNTQHL